MSADPKTLVEALRRLVKAPVSVMEVCGTHTVSIFRSGIRSLLPDTLRLVSGPGCPVCVTDQGEIEAALSLLERGVTLAAYGDMFKVPSAAGSLSSMAGKGHDARIVTSAMDALRIAGDAPDREVVFLGVGFETTAPATAAVVREARRIGARNFSVLSFHKRTPPVLRALAGDPELGLSGFLLPGHVCVILGHEPFRFLPETYGIPSVIAGFEPEQILLGLADIAVQIASGAPSLRSVYGAVRPGGNVKALRLLDDVFVVRDSVWRGIGPVPGSGYALSEEYAGFDAERRYDIQVVPGQPIPGCRCGDVLKGRITPPECPLFRERCTPLSPVGPCMVSSEGTCGAYFRFHRGGRHDG